MHINNLAAFKNSLVIIFILALASLVAAQDPAPAEYTQDSVFEDAVLNVTNTYRRQHNATAVEWNSTLAVFAEKAGGSCVFKHSGGPYGENLASGYPNASASIDAWGHERVDYDFQKGEFSHETGHFTQLVWKATTSVGCSRTDCKDSDGGAPGWYVICEYHPRGNVIGAFKQNVQQRVKEQDEPSDPSPYPYPSSSSRPSSTGPGSPQKTEECIQGALCSAGRRVNEGITWPGIVMGAGLWALVWWTG